ncbi:GNAT family N-acetyltransferase, partial [Streptomyces sp. NPDC059810]|uniref:GNAT family N-acetyltransferase n=1 Tax=Streptomyces sp. NPDC059810 TaxID=3346956 RepID=UPI0036519264
MTEIRTPRLILRRWSDDDLVPLAEINADHEVMRWIGDGSVLDLERTAEDIERYEEEWDEEGFGIFAVELIASGELIGFAGLSLPEFLPEVMPDVEIGWRLGRQFWGQGYASEAAHAVGGFGPPAPPRPPGGGRPPHTQPPRPEPGGIKNTHTP